MNTIKEKQTKNQFKKDVLIYCLFTVLALSLPLTASADPIISSSPTGLDAAGDEFDVEYFIVEISLCGYDDSISEAYKEALKGAQQFCGKGGTVETNDSSCTASQTNGEWEVCCDFTCEIDTSIGVGDTVNVFETN